jgi:hypothetical protein
MNLIKKGSKIYGKIISTKNPLFNLSVAKQKTYLNKFSTPKDNFERSYNQYLCQKKGLSFFNNTAMNLGCFFLYFYYFYFKKNDQINTNNEKYNALFISSPSNYSCIPESLFDEFKTIKQKENKGFYLTKSDKALIKILAKKHRLSFFFLTKCLLKVAMYSKNIAQHNPEAIIVTSEYSFTSSVLTQYCNNNNIIHIDIMHGEKLFFIRDSFFNFDRCYVWDQHFVDLFNQLRAKDNQYIIEIPPSQEKWKAISIKQDIDFTYYLGDESKELLLEINKNLIKLQSNGYKIAIRPHPVYSPLEFINEKFIDFEIEDSSIDIQHSILRTKAVISLYSTVNRQAYNNNVKYVIDDISDPEHYNQMRDLQYYFIKEKHSVLSDFIK